MYVLQDFEKTNPATVLWGLFIGTSLRAVFLYRISSWLYMHKLKPIATFFWSLNVALHSCDISPAARIGKGFRLYHTVGVVIGAGTVIGDTFTIHQNVTIGTNKINKYPVIGNNVALFSGAVVIGDITIGDNVAVGANAVVVKDVPSDSVAIGIPAVHKPKNC